MMLRMLGSLLKWTRPSQPDCVVLLHSIYLSPEKPHRYFQTRKSSLFSSFWDKCEKMETNGNPYVMDMVLEGWHVLKLLQHSRSSQYEHFRVRYTYHFNIVVQRSSSHRLPVALKRHNVLWCCVCWVHYWNGQGHHNQIASCCYTPFICRQRNLTGTFKLANPHYSHRFGINVKKWKQMAILTSWTWY